VIGLVRALAVEFGAAGIRANGIAPGFIRTAQSLSVEHSLGEEGLRAAAATVPLQRIGEPDEVADVALFLASDAARYMSGQVLVVDGGLLVRQG
jgi:3-oxoacyl-[acyl-carrier protein] reductase